MKIFKIVRKRKFMTNCMETDVVNPNLVVEKA